MDFFFAMKCTQIFHESIALSMDYLSPLSFCIVIHKVRYMNIIQIGLFSIKIFILSKVISLRLYLKALNLFYQFLLFIFHIYATSSGFFLPLD